IDAAIAAPRNQRIRRAALERRVEAIAGLEREAGHIQAVALQRTDPALLRHHYRNRLVDHARFERGALFLLDQRAALVAVLLRVAFDFLDEQTLHRGFAAQQFFKLGL